MTQRSNPTKRLRTAMKRSHPEFAKEIKASVKTIRNWEQGRHMTPTVWIGMWAMVFIWEVGLWEIFKRFLREESR